MVEETQCRESRRTTSPAKEQWAEKQRWLASYLRPVQGLNIEGYHPPHPGNDLRCPSQIVLESAEGCGLDGRAADSSGSAATDETWVESRVFASVFELDEYYDSEVAE